MGKRFTIGTLAVLLAVEVCLGQPPPVSEQPVKHDPSNNWLPALSNGNAPNLPVGSKVNGIVIATGGDVASEQVNGSGTATITWTGGKTFLRQTNPLTASVVGFLPAASSFPAGRVITYGDSVTPKTAAYGVAWTPQGLDTINGGTNPVTVGTGPTTARFETDGVSAWTQLDSHLSITSIQDAINPAIQVALDVSAMPVGTSTIHIGAGTISDLLGTSTVRGKAKTICLSVRTDGKTGTGTEEDPYDASGTKCDTRLAALAAAHTQNLDIHLIGTGFQTDVASTGLGTAFYVQNGWHIHGDGMYVTTVTMTGSMAGQHFDHEAFKAPQSTPADNVTISDLTIDANFSALNASADTVNSEKDFVAYGVGINGSNNTIERVRVINQYGTFANGGESFGINLSTGATGGSGAVIRFCVVEQPHGTYAGSPFAIAGYDTTHLMKQFRVYGNYAFGVNDGITTATFNTGGVNLAFASDGEIYNNFFVDCRGFAYCDTGNVDSIIFRDNHTIHAWQGAGFIADEGSQPTWTKTNLCFSGNSVNIQDRNNGEVSAFRFAGGTGIQVTGTNTVSTSTGGSGSGLQYWTVLAQGMTNIAVMDLCGPDEHAQVTGTAITKKRNFTPAGAIITGLEDNQFFSIIADPHSDGDMRVQGEFASTVAYNSSPIAGLLFANKFNSAGDQAGMGGIGVGKENSTDGNVASFLSLYTRPAGGSTTERFRISSAGAFSLLGDTTVTAAPTTDGSAKFVLDLQGTTAYGSSPVTGVRFANKYNSAGDLTGMGSVTVGKENGTDGNYASYLALSTRANGGSITEQVRVDSSGNLIVNNLTASNYVKTNGSKALVSAATIPFSDVTGTVGVSQGGTGDATLTAYAPLFGGTTSTGAVQSGTVGTSGQLLTSNGAGALPTFQNAPSGADQLGLTPTAVKTANYTAAAGDLVPCDTTSAGFTVTLPTAPADKSVVAIKHVIQGGTNTVSLATGGSDVFNKASGGTSGTLTLVNQGLLLQYKASGAIWYAIADDIPLSGMDSRYVNVSGALGTPSSGTVTNLTGTASININGTVGATTPTTGEFTNLTLSGNQSAAAWTTSGLRLKGITGTLTDTTSSGTVAAAYTNKLGGNTIAASSATTFTDYISGYFSEPVAGSNVTLTNKWALGADSLYVGTSNPFKVTSAGALTMGGTQTINKTSAAGVREQLFKGTVSDATTDFFFIGNGTSTDSSFLPVFGGIVNERSDRYSLGFEGFTTSTTDASDSSSYGLVDFAALRSDSSTDPLNGTLSAVVNRKLFTFRNSTGASGSDFLLTITPSTATFGTAITGVVVSGTTDSTTSTTGSLKTAGGLGVAKAVNVGTTLQVAGVTTLTGGGTSTTATAGDNTTQIATTAFVKAAVPTASYRTVVQTGGLIAAGKVVGNYFFSYSNGGVLVSGANFTWPPEIVYIASADFPSVNGAAATLRVRAELFTNHTAPTSTFTVGLYPVTLPGSAGGTGVTIYNLGTVVSGSTVAFTTPAADSTFHDVSTDFALPSDGFYAVGVTTTTATAAANSNTHITARLQTRN